jgi:prevent-host-death family protein
MSSVNITELRQNLPTYVEQARKGKDVRITVRGKVVARLIADKDEQEAARLRLIALRKTCYLGDVLSPSGDTWDAESGNR